MLNVVIKLVDLLDRKYTSVSSVSPFLIFPMLVISFVMNCSFDDVKAVFTVNFFCLALRAVNRDFL